MQTKISKKYRSHEQIAEAEAILRACVHCGFCAATCPTYQALGDELDSPRGRIYLIKQVLEDQQVSVETQKHLDRCLTCRSCETTCPSGVKYSRLLTLGRELVEQQVPRKISQQLKRFLLRQFIPYPKRLAPILAMAQLVSPLLPNTIKTKIRPLSRSVPTQLAPRSRKMLLLEGCVQSISTPAVNQSARQVLHKLGIELVSVSTAGCCGALSHHMQAQQEGLEFMRRNIDAWWPYIEQGAEAIVSTASGCGVTLKEYGDLLKNDVRYAEKARKVSELCQDLSETLQQETWPDDTWCVKPLKVAFHDPCTLQHGLKLTGVVEPILKKAGFTLTHVKDSHLCCGSAGAYSLLQPLISQHLLSNKLRALEYEKPDVIATANIGCHMHLSSKAKVPVVHWIELLNDAGYSNTVEKV